MLWVGTGIGFEAGRLKWPRRRERSPFTPIHRLLSTVLDYEVASHGALEKPESFARFSLTMKFAPVI